MRLPEVECKGQGAESAEEAGVPGEGRSQWQVTGRRLRSDKMSMTAAAVIVVMVLLALLAPVFAGITHHPPDTAYPLAGENAYGNPVGPFVNGFWLGTDSTGRDLCSSPSTVSSCRWLMRTVYRSLSASASTA